MIDLSQFFIATTWIAFSLLCLIAFSQWFDVWIQRRLPHERDHTQDRREGGA